MRPAARALVLLLASASFLVRARAPRHSVHQLALGRFRLHHAACTQAEFGKRCSACHSRGSSATHASAAPRSAFLMPMQMAGSHRQARPLPPVWARARVVWAAVSKAAGFAAPLPPLAFAASRSDPAQRAPQRRPIWSKCLSPAHSERRLRRHSSNRPILTRRGGSISSNSARRCCPKASIRPFQRGLLSTWSTVLSSGGIAKNVDVASRPLLPSVLSFPSPRSRPV